MTDYILMVLVGAAAIILAVVIYNLYQEKRYRDKVRAQFGHADRDVLLEEAQSEVRDSQTGVFTPAFNAQLHNKTAADTPDNVPHTETETTLAATEKEDTVTDITLEEVTETTHDAVTTSKTLWKLDDLARMDLPWFEQGFDYMAYIALRRPQELTALPRLSGRHRINLAAATMDQRFQPAEPIPGVLYQAFVIGMQAISRQGLASVEDLQHFGKKTREFAQQMDGEIQLEDIDAFLHMAKPLDELCSRVDQFISLHLIARNPLQGEQLFTSLTQAGFEWSHDGAFYYPNVDEPLYSLVNIDAQKPFSRSELKNELYRGFSMLFDITHVPPGKQYFDQFMNLAVTLAADLSLDLVNDKLEELSTEWLSNLGEFVSSRQHEMKSVGITPGGELAKRIFS